MAGAGALQIRPFERTDAAAIARLFRAAVLAIDRQLYSASQLAAWADRSDPAELEARCTSAMTWVASVDGEVAGFIAFEPDGHVDLAFVHPSHQGQGVARALHAEVEAEARRRRLARLFTEASLAARPFFERAGYRVLRRNDVRVADQVLSNWSMERRLISPGDARRVFVIGNSGSGKTTFARGLAERLGRPHLDLDAVAFSDQADTRRPVEASVELLTATLGFDARPVIEGCYADLVQALADADDHLVWLDLPVAACIDNARARPWEPHKWPNADAQDAFLPRLIAFIEGYPTDPAPTGRPAHAQLFSDFPGAGEAHRVRPFSPA